MKPGADGELFEQTRPRAYPGDFGQKQNFTNGRFAAATPFTEPKRLARVEQKARNLRMLTPAKYWRVSCGLKTTISEPCSEFTLPPALANQVFPPARGHGIAIAAYEEAEQTGLLRWFGTITGGVGPTRTVDWKPTTTQIWIDTDKGRRYWQAGPFGFSRNKIGDYGLHELWLQHFESLELRDHARMATRPKGAAMARSGRVAPERLNPLEVIGSPTSGVLAGVVYVLESAYGYKIGRTRSMPDRMRVFGVQLPFMYKIPFCVWFDDCHAAERRFHNVFASKRINGEWFDLDESDLELIRRAA